MPITVSGTTITFNDATTQTTAFTGGGGVTSLNGQTGAITDTNFNAIGSVGAGGVLGNGATYNANSTIGGGSIVETPGPSQYNPFQTFPANGGNRSAGYSGTWRAMADSKNSAITPKSGGNYTVHSNLWMRVS